jgi:hypothetical protein
MGQTGRNVLLHFWLFLFFSFERQMIVAFSVGWICPFCYSSCFTLISSKIHVIAGDGFATHFGGHDRAFTSSGFL